MKPTKEQWDEVISSLSRVYHPVYLLCDGYYVEYTLIPHEFKLVIHCYVNGWIKGEWFLREDGGDYPEIARRFYRPSVMSRFTRKFIREMEKACGKRYCKEHGYYDKVLLIKPDWLRPRPLIKHLQNSCDDIRIISYDYYMSGTQGKSR